MSTDSDSVLRMDVASDTTDHTRMHALLGLFFSIDRIYAAASREVSLSPQQAELLCLVEYERPALGELADALGCDKANVTGLVDRVAKRDLVERATDEYDRRVTRVEVTDKGRQLVARFHDRLEARLAGLELGDGVTPAAINAITEQLAGTGDPPP